MFKDKLISANNYWVVTIFWAYAKHVMYIISCTLCNNPVGDGLLLSSFGKWGGWSNWLRVSVARLKSCNQEVAEPGPDFWAGRLYTRWYLLCDLWQVTFFLWYSSSSIETDGANRTIPKIPSMLLLEVGDKDVTNAMKMKISLIKRFPSPT